MKTVAFLAMFMLALTTASASMWYVDSSVPASGDGKSWETAFQAIQEGIDAASSGDTVTVAQGTYVENIHFSGKNIVLTSTDPLDPTVVENTIIDGNQAGSVVAFLGTEDETCVLAGFTIRNGKASYDQGVFGGGVRGGLAYEENLTHATIRNNVITDNWGDRGGGLGLCAGLIQSNTISNNSSGRGGAMRFCHGIIENNIITGNTSTGEGAGGLDNCNALIQNNVISGNSGLDSDGEGALAGCNGIIQNNLIIGNSSRGGAAGLVGCSGPILNNTVVGNSSTGDESYAGGLGGCGGIIRSCIIWGNTGPEGVQMYGCSEPAYSCIQDWDGAGTGNTDEAPLFVNAIVDDYRLQSDSPCIDNGINYYWPAWPQCDLDGNCRLIGETVDMGCYEYDSSPDSDGDLLSDADEPAAGTDADHDDTDGDGLRDGLELMRGLDPLTPTPPGIVNIPSDLPTVQAALCLAINGDEIIVDHGTYRENLLFCGQDIVLRSSDPKSPGIVALTILDGDGTGPVVSLTGRETEACVLSGFTIRNGNAGIGGGVYGGGGGNPTHATIQNNTITENSARGSGGGLAFCDGLIQNNTITENSARGGGGGLAFCDGLIQNNTICGNSARAGGGLGECHGTIHNNIICGNSVTWAGGGLYECYGTIRNNTITGNSADWDGGGLYFCTGTIANCIIWGNTAPDAPQLCNCAQPSYSCIQGYTGGGEGNIAQDPRFLDRDKGDFRLSPSSPCVDAGYNDPGLPDTDIAGMHRIMYGGKSMTVDMGAYEFHIWPPSFDSQTGEIGLKWSSLAGKTYSVYRSGDMVTWELATDSIPSLGDTFTTWLDSTTLLPFPEVRIRFYRIIENE